MYNFETLSPNLGYFMDFQWGLDQNKGDRERKGNTYDGSSLGRSLSAAFMWSFR